MTQVANLNTAVSAPVKTNTASKQEKPQELLAEFAGIMNQSTQSFLHTATADYGARNEAMTDDVFSMTRTGETAQNDYEKLGSTGSRKIAQAKTEPSDKEGVSQKVQQLADDVKDTVEETMQVSEEDIELAMEALGLETLDLLQPQNLIGLVQELTGSADVGALLTNENFQITMQEVTGLITDFQQENGLNAAQFADLLGQLSAQIDELEETVKELLNVEEPAQAVPVTADVQTEGLPEELLAGQEVPEESAPAAPRIVSAAERETPVAAPAQEETQAVSEQMNEPAPVMAEENMEESAQTADQEENQTPQDGKNKQQAFTDAAEREPAATEHHTAVFHENTVTANEQIATPAPETPQVQSYIELEHLMDQLEGLARSFASAAGTTVEMQLNPENLGRLVLSVTEKHGNVTAQITASNEQVKEALQTQMVELRSTLQAQGIKVEAVEVTVATHEFEQNLDGNASANGQMQEQAQGQGGGQQSGRRNLNINSLDELSGLMSEEEMLAAQMMRDNGGTVDFSA